jgi:hypothetical protein
VIEALRRTLFRVLALVRSRALDADLEQEIEHHLALAADEHVRQGLSPHEARRRARLDFGGIQNAREAHRQARCHFSKARSRTLLMPCAVFVGIRSSRWALSSSSRSPSA